MAAFSTFASNNPRRKDFLHSNRSDIPIPGETRWYYRSHTISVLYDKYKTLLDLLESTIESLKGWDDAYISQANGLDHFMKNFLFCFLVHVLNRILEQSSLLYIVLQNQNTDFNYGCQKISAFGNYLSDLHTDSAYHHFFQSAVSLVREPSSNADKRHDCKKSIFSSC